MQMNKSWKEDYWVLALFYLISLSDLLQSIDKMFLPEDGSKWQWTLKAANRYYWWAKIFFHADFSGLSEWAKWKNRKPSMAMLITHTEHYQVIHCGFSSTIYGYRPKSDKPMKNKKILTSFFHHKKVDSGYLWIEHWKFQQINKVVWIVVKATQETLFH